MYVKSSEKYFLAIGNINIILSQSLLHDSIKIFLSFKHLSIKKFQEIYRMKYRKLQFLF